LKKIIIFILTLLFFSPACDKDSTSDQPEIKKIGWFLNNIDRSFWVADAMPNDCSISFEIYFNNDISYKDISSVEITASESGIKWFSDKISSDSFDDDEKILYCSYLWTFIADAIYIGDYNFVIELSDGKEIKYNFTVPAPADATVKDYKVACSDSNPMLTHPIYSSQYVSMIKKAQEPIGIITTAAQTLSFSFKTDDVRTYSGLLVFFDANGKFVAETKDVFRSYDLKKFSYIINGGAGLFTDNTNNQVNLIANELYYYEGKSFSDIKSFCVILTDGSQYENKPKSKYDCRSISKKTQITFK